MHLQEGMADPPVWWLGTSIYEGPENPGTIVVFHFNSGPTTNTYTFARVVWSLIPFVEGFWSFHPVISIDSTYLYGKYKGTMLVALGLMLMISYSHLYSLLWKVRIMTIEVGSWLAFRGWRNDLTYAWYETEVGVLFRWSDHYLGWFLECVHHFFCVRHHASNFNSKFYYRSLMMLLVCHQCGGTCVVTFYSTWEMGIIPSWGKTCRLLTANFFKILTVF